MGSDETAKHAPIIRNLLTEELLKAELTPYLPSGLQISKGEIRKRKGINRGLRSDHLPETSHLPVRLNRHSFFNKRKGNHRYREGSLEILQRNKDQGDQEIQRLRRQRFLCRPSRPREQQDIQRMAGGKREIPGLHPLQEALQTN